MFTRISVAALLAGLAAAQHAPVGEPSGNPINRPLTEIVPACKEFTILWQPTTPNSVSLVLLRGPAENIKPLSIIVTGITNSGSFKWTPSSGLEADTTHYGLQIIDDVTGQFQYSNQFGISKGPECNSLAPSSAASTPHGGGYPVSTSAQPSKASSSKGYPVSTPISDPVFTKADTTMTTKSNTTMTTKTLSVALTTGAPAGNSTILQPTKPLSVPSSLRPTASGSASPTVPTLPESTGAASSLHAGLSLVGAAAAFAFIL